MSEPVVRLDDAVAVLGQFPVLARASLVKPARSCCCVVRMVPARPASCGSVPGCSQYVRGAGSVLGLDLTQQREAIRRTVGLLGRQNGLYLDLTVAENVHFWGSTVGTTNTETAAAMQRTTIADRLADVEVRKLSAGQKRRTALAC